MSFNRFQQQDVGLQFELMLGRLFEEKGYDVELNKVLAGRSGAKYEFDGVGYQGRIRRKLEVGWEAKYRSDGSPDRKDIESFVLRAHECKIPDAYFITNSYYTDDEIQIAREYKIQLIDGPKLAGELRDNKMERYVQNRLGNSFLESLCIGVGRGVINLVDSSGRLSNQLIPRYQNNPLQLNTDPNLYRGLNERYQNRSNNSTPNVNSNSISLPHRTNQTENSRAGLINPKDFELIERPNVSFSSIGGLEDIKDQLKMKVIYPFTNPDVYKEYDLEPGSVLLYGPPGCGKTMLAKAVANECRGQFISPKIRDIIKRYSGDTLQVISSIFQYSRNNCQNPLVFLDELDVYMSRKSNAYDTRIKNEFLEQMDGVCSWNKKIILLGATNKPWLLDVAIRRPGRFNKLIFVTPPDYEARREILKLYTKDLFSKNLIAENEDRLIENLVSRTEGWSGADLKALVDDSKEGGILDKIKRRISDRRLTWGDFERTLSRRKNSVDAWFTEAIRSCERYGENQLLEEISKYTERRID